VIFPVESWRELTPALMLQYSAVDARCRKWELRKCIYMNEQMDDNSVLENNWIVTRSFSDTG